MRSSGFLHIISREEFVMSIVGWIVFGIIVGVIARFLRPGPDPMGIIVTCLLGIAGSFVGGYLGHLIKGGDIDSAGPAGFLGSIIGAVLLLVIYHMVSKRPAA
jgi:uncharacterized membrane protein YeaQ/YmgE (transglycosylase-associated protein family)